MTKIKAGNESQFLNEKQTEELLEITNSATVEGAGEFVQVEFTDRMIENISLKSPFYDFLVSKNRVFPTDYAKGAFRDVEIPAGARSAFSANETGSDITGAALDFNAPVYRSAIIARKIAVSTMLETGDPSFDYMEYQRQSATQDNYSALDQGLFNTHQQNRFDGIKETTNNVIDKQGDPITLRDIDYAVEKVMNRGGIVDGIIATGGAIAQLVSADEGNQKIFPDKAEVILGKWATQIMTASGLVPLIADPNINNRSNTKPADNSEAVYIIDSSAIEIDVQHESISRLLGATDFSDAELVGTFARMGNLNPYRNAVIKGIQGLTAKDVRIVFTVTDSVGGAAISGATVKVSQVVNGITLDKTATTGADGKAEITVNGELPYDLSVAKSTYTTYTATVTAANISETKAVELVKS